MSEEHEIPTTEEVATLAKEAAQQFVTQYEEGAGGCVMEVEDAQLFAKLLKALIRHVDDQAGRVKELETQNAALIENALQHFKNPNPTKDRFDMAMHAINSQRDGLKCADALWKEYDQKARTARNDALREAAKVCTGDSERPAKIGRHKLRRMSASEQLTYETTRMAWQDADEILSLIEEDSHPLSVDDSVNDAEADRMFGAIGDNA